MSFSFLFILALADFSFSSFVCKGCQVAKKKCAMTEVGSKEGEKKTASKSKKRALCKTQEVGKNNPKFHQK